jgi:hypothetical protein
MTKNIIDIEHSLIKFLALIQYSFEFHTKLIFNFLRLNPSLIIHNSFNH